MPCQDINVLSPGPVSAAVVVKTAPQRVRKPSSSPAHSPRAAPSYQLAVTVSYANPLVLHIYEVLTSEACGHLPIQPGKVHMCLASSPYAGAKDTEGLPCGAASRGFCLP